LKGLESELMSNIIEAESVVPLYQQLSNIIEEKKASNNDENLDFETIFKVLRKQEYLDLLTDRNINIEGIEIFPNEKTNLLE